MKALLLSILLSLSFSSLALGNLDQLNTENKAQLIDVLNQMSPEMLSSTLSEEGLEWYINQFTRSGHYGESLQLIDILNQLSPENLELLLSEDALNWYISQFTRTGQDDDVIPFTSVDFNSNHGRADIGYDGFNDQNAPTFN